MLVITGITLQNLPSYKLITYDRNILENSKEWNRFKKFLNNINIMKKDNIGNTANKKIKITIPKNTKVLILQFLETEVDLSVFDTSETESTLKHLKIEFVSAEGRIAIVKNLIRQNILSYYFKSPTVTLVNLQAISYYQLKDVHVSKRVILDKYISFQQQYSFEMFKYWLVE